MAGADGNGTGGEEAVSVDEALEYAVQLHRGGKRDLARTLYQRILQAVPDHPDALHFYGLLHHHEGRSEEAIALLLRAVEVGPANPSALSNLGNIFAETERLDEAVSAYEAAVAVEPGFADALSNLGAALRRLGRFEEAETAYQRAIAANPNHREAHDNLGRLYANRGWIDEAIACHTKALELEPRNADTRRLLTATYATLGEREKAKAILRDWLADEPTSPTALHLYAAVSGENVPERAGDAYVRTMFDSFAASFDSKLAKLSYRAPELVTAALRRALGAEAAPVPMMLDAGCGTGLCGPLVRPMAQRLVGIDLSPNMLERAFDRKIYDELETVELTAYLLAHSGRFDAILSADTLCYFGDLTAVVAAASGALRPGAPLIFTVERHGEDEPFRINTHGRYSHRADHVQEAIEAAGLTLDSLEEDVLRAERGRPVDGLVVTARKPA